MFAMHNIKKGPDKINRSGSTTGLRPELKTELKEAVREVLVETLRDEREELFFDQEMSQPLMSAKCVARKLAVSLRTVEKVVALGELVPIWIEGQRRFHPDVVDAYIRSCDSKPPQIQNGRASR